MLYYNKCDDQKEVPQFPYLHREPVVGESRRGETGNTFCEQRTKRIFTHGVPMADPCIYPSRLRRDVPVIEQGHRLCDSRRFSLSLANGVSHVPDEAGCCKTPAK